MAIKKITCTDLIPLLHQLPVFDVRSPGEYEHAHIPGAHSLPLFSDDERAIVGTLYKQKGKTFAIKAGLDYFGPKMTAIITQVETQLKSLDIKDNKIVVHCWRGGMRSAGVAWLLDLYGYDVTFLVGGYKAFRNWVLERFLDAYSFKILGGYTGSAKTETIKALEKNGATCIDLEGLAHHKGSAFGGIDQPAQPSQEMFENKLALQLKEKIDHPIWLEDESQRIGILNIPHQLWATMRKSPVFFLEIPFEHRLSHILQHYGCLSKEKLIEAVERIQKRFGPNETKMTLEFLQEDNTEAAFRILLEYYDRQYVKSLQKREGLEMLLKKIEAKEIDPESTAKLILNKN